MANCEPEPTAERGTEETPDCHEDVLRMSSPALRDQQAFLTAAILDGIQMQRDWLREGNEPGRVLVWFVRRLQALEDELDRRERITTEWTSEADPEDGLVCPAGGDPEMWAELTTTFQRREYQNFIERGGKTLRTRRSGRR